VIKSSDCPGHTDSFAAPRIPDQSGGGLLKLLKLFRRCAPLHSYVPMVNTAAVPAVTRGPTRCQLPVCHGLLNSTNMYGPVPHVTNLLD
jgi:hypothetical protein